MLPNLSLVMELVPNIFTNLIFLKNFSRMKHWLREKLQLPVTIKRSSSSAVISRLSSQLESELFVRTYVVGGNLTVVLLTALANRC